MLDAKFVTHAHTEEEESLQYYIGYKPQDWIWIWIYKNLIFPDITLNISDTILDSSGNTKNSSHESNTGGPSQY